MALSKGAKTALLLGGATVGVVVLAQASSAGSTEATSPLPEGGGGGGGTDVVSQVLGALRNLGLPVPTVAPGAGPSTVVVPTAEVLRDRVLVNPFNLRLGSGDGDGLGGRGGAPGAAATGGATFGGVNFGGLAQLAGAALGLVGLATGNPVLGIVGAGLALAGRAPALLGTAKPATPTQIGQPAPVAARAPVTFLGQPVPQLSSMGTFEGFTPGPGFGIGEEAASGLPGSQLSGPSPAELEAFGALSSLDTGGATFAGFSPGPGFGAGEQAASGLPGSGQSFSDFGGDGGGGADGRDAGTAGDAGTGTGAESGSGFV